MIDRRTFVIFTGAAALLLTLPKSSCAAERQAHLVRIVTYVPRRIFFSTRSSGAPVLLSSLELTDEDKTVSGSFSNGQTIQFDSNSSSLNTVQKSKGQRVTRQSVLPRSLAAWVIDAVWQSLHNKRNPTTIAQLRGNFEGFQRQSILEAVTPVSLYNLVRDSALRNQITSVAWNREALRFEVK
jgi:hypothetical protein